MNSELEAPAPLPPRRAEAPPTQPWTMVIEPHGRLLDLKLKELWQYRDLIYLFVRRDFLSQYAQTVLGPAWHLLQPLLTTVMFTIVFGKIANIPTDGAPPFLFYMAGTIIWAYFSGVLTATATTFTANAGMFGKVYFPRLAVPVATLFSKLIGFGVQFLFFLCFIGYFMLCGAGVKLNAWVLLTPVLLLMMAALALGMGIIVAALTTRYRDLAVIITFGVQLLMYATPIIYPVSALPERYQPWMALNPIAPIAESFRHAYLSAGTVDLGMLGISAAVISVILFIGIVMFNRVERTFMDSV